jgi:NADP-dependent aldehyde dehydrogenase
MLHAGIYRSYNEKRENVISQADVELIATSSSMAAELEAVPTIACVSGDNFMTNPQLHKEVFGPFSLIVKCRNKTQMMELAGELEGQLTCSIMGTVNDFLEHHELVETLALKCGRMIMNGVPTGVEVCWSMQHGGPFPSTTDARFGSVGPDAIKRFVRPLSFQGFPDQLLPEALKTGNPLQIPRIENGKPVF